MLTRLAIFLHAHGRRVLLVSVIGAAIAGAFGVGVAKHLSPYGATDPATQSVQAGNRFQHAASHQIDAGVVALVNSGDVRSAAARHRRHGLPETVENFGSGNEDIDGRKSLRLSPGMAARPWCRAWSTTTTSRPGTLGTSTAWPATTSWSAFSLITDQTRAGAAHAKDRVRWSSTLAAKRPERDQAFW